MINGWVRTLLWCCAVMFVASFTASCTKYLQNFTPHKYEKPGIESVLNDAVKESQRNEDRRAAEESEARRVEGLAR